MPSFQVMAVYISFIRIPLLIAWKYQKALHITQDLIQTS